MLTIAIPSKTEKFLRRTILDVLEKATGDIEVLPILDGYDPPEDEIVTDPRVRYIRLPAVSYSQKRHGINRAVSEAKGKYVMSLDAHCMMAPGFDKQLIKDHRPNWVQIPRRHRLDADKWSLQPQSDNRPPIDYEYYLFPLLRKNKSIHGFKWDERTLSRWNIPLDDTIEFQGSCWFMTKKWFQKMGFMQTEGYTGWGQEAEEISLTTWKNGGRVITNKNTWYAHLHKGSVHGRMYHLSREENRRSYDYSYHHWLIENKDFFIGLLENFMPMPGWPENWKQILWPNDFSTTTASITPVTTQTATAIIKKNTTMKANKKNSTVIYITTNSEDIKFEHKVRKELEKSSAGLPIISVSQKPIRFGKNISVGKAPLTESTLLKQILIGLEKCKTKYAILAKDDCVYPPEYFAHTPQSDDRIFQYSNVWVLGDKYWQTHHSEVAQKANRKFWISQIKQALSNQNGWEIMPVSLTLPGTDKTSWIGENPVINFKSTSGLRRFPSVIRNLLPKRSLPYWGSAQELKTKMCA